MWCPFCHHPETRVIDSRLSGEGTQVRRRRLCTRCDSRFSTFESAVLKAPNVIKSDGNREPFDENKLRAGMLKALEKRPVSTGDIEHSIRRLVRHIKTLEDNEISSRQIGEWVMGELRRLDEVAYIRFASVYRRFEDVQAFREEIERLERGGPAVDDQRQISLLKQHRR